MFPSLYGVSFKMLARVCGVQFKCLPGHAVCQLCFPDSEECHLNVCQTMQCASYVSQTVKNVI
jgi:hypothetical protein